MTSQGQEFRPDCVDGRSFENLIAELSLRFVHLASDEVDGAIEEAQRQVCECLECDLSALWRWSSLKPNSLTITHLYSPPTGPDLPEGIDAQEGFPWMLERLLLGETLVVHNETMPPDAARDVESRRFFGVESSVAIPLSVGGGPLIGILTFDVLHRDREWPESVVERLQLIAQVFTNALARQKADAALKESEARLELAAGSAGAGLWSLDLRDMTFWTTPQGMKLLGLGPKERMTWQRFREMVLPEDRKVVDEAMNHLVSSQGSLAIEYRIRRTDGEVRWLESRGCFHSAKPGSYDHITGATVDSTENKTRNLEIRSLKEELAHLDRVGMLGELSGSIAHELNQPLSAILTNAQAGQRFIDAEDVDIGELKEIFEDIVDDNRRASSFITHLRSLFNRQELDREYLSVNQVVGQVEKLVHSRLILNAVVCQTEFASDLPRIAGDSVQLQQVLINLINNAVDAMLAVERSERKLSIRTEVVQDGVQICVCDRGPGLTSDAMTQAFDPFFTTKDSGMGLGLALSRTIALAHGGKLEARNRSGGGAAFSLTLPSE